MKILVILVLFFEYIFTLDAVWSTYKPNIMYSGQYNAINPPNTKNAGTSFTFSNQTIYRNDVLSSERFPINSLPQIVLSLMGYNQNAPPNVDTFVGFDVNITTIRNTGFDVKHNIYGGSITYLHYMYLAYIKPQYNSQFYMQNFDTQSIRKNYYLEFHFPQNEIDIYQNAASDHKIQVKGFLCGYKLKQKTANGIFLNFSMIYLNFSFFAINVSTDVNSQLQSIWFYRMTYDRTAIQRSTYNDIFRDFSYELVSNQNTINTYSAGWTSQTQFQYRNYLMGTNKININGTGPTKVQFYLYYYFAKSLALVDTVYPPFLDNPATAQYLYGQTFYHAIKYCPNPNNTQEIYYLGTTRKCTNLCPVYNFYQDFNLKACVPCHKNCLTCRLGFEKSKCQSCNVSDFRGINQSLNQCICMNGYFDNGIDKKCIACPITCLTCISSDQNGCKLCNQTLNRFLYFSQNNITGTCKCMSSFYQNQNNLCIKCLPGCLNCTNDGIKQICYNCNQGQYFQLKQKVCQCINKYAFYSKNTTCLKCSFGCLNCVKLQNNSQICSLCDSTNNFQLLNNMCICQNGFSFDLSNANQDKLCKKCSGGCLNCSINGTDQICFQCNSTNNFLLNVYSCECKLRFALKLVNENQICQICSEGCISCSFISNNQTCHSCNSTLNYQLSQNSSCFCASGFSQISINQSKICQKCDLGCISCIKSQNSSNCIQCNKSANFQLNISKGNCQCFPGYTLNNDSCVNNICGDGILSKPEQCDDKNTLNKDGCSSDCKIQPYHNCTNNKDLFSYSICYYNGNINMKITKIQKSPFENVVDLEIKISAQGINYNNLNDYLQKSFSIDLQDIKQSTRLLIKRDLIETSSPQLVIDQSKTKYDSLTQILYLSFSYSKTFDITKKKIKFKPSSNVSSPYKKYFYESPQVTITLQKTYNKIQTIFFNKSDYNQVQTLYIVFYVVLGIFWIGTLILFFIGKGNIAMQSMIVLQISYGSLLTQQNLQITFAGLGMIGKYTAGYNYNFMPIDLNIKCVSFISIDLNCSLIDNLNISILILILLVIIYLLLTCYNRYKNYKSQKEFNEDRRNQMLNNNSKTMINLNQNQINKNEYNEDKDQLQHQQNKLSIQTEYKEKQFVHKKIFSTLLDLIYFLTFLTSIIYGLSLCFIKQSKIPSIILGVVAALFYVGIWIYWFKTNKLLKFSFILTQLRHEIVYKSQKNSQINNNSQNGQINFQIQQNQSQAEQKIVKKSKIQKYLGKIIRIIYYPIIWLLLLIFSFVLSQTQSIGYVSQGLIIGSSALFAVIIWLTNIYKQRINVYRAILNCLIICLIQICLIISHIDSTNNPENNGFVFSVAICSLLGCTFVVNFVSSIYLFRIQFKLSKKRSEERELEQIQAKIQKLEERKRKKQIKNMNLTLNFNNHTILFKQKQKKSQLERFTTATKLNQAQSRIESGHKLNSTMFKTKQTFASSNNNFSDQSPLKRNQVSLNNLFADFSSQKKESINVGQIKLGFYDD